jgi:hypothetical protein
VSGEYTIKQTRFIQAVKPDDKDGLVVAFNQQRRCSAIAALYACHGAWYAPTLMFPPPYFDRRRSVFYRATSIHAPNVFTGITALRHLTSIATHTAIQRRARTPLEQLVPATAPRSGMRANRLPLSCGEGYETRLLPTPISTPSPPAATPLPTTASIQGKGKKARRSHSLHSRQGRFGREVSAVEITPLSSRPPLSMSTV